MTIQDPGIAAQCRNCVCARARKTGCRTIVKTVLPTLTQVGVGVDVPSLARKGDAMMWLVAPEASVSSGLTGVDAVSAVVEMSPVAAGVGAALAAAATTATAGEEAVNELAAWEEKRAPSMVPELGSRRQHHRT